MTMPHRDSASDDGCNVVELRRGDFRAATCREEARGVVETQTIGLATVTSIAAQSSPDAGDALEHAYEQIMMEHFLHDADPLRCGPDTFVVTWSVTEAGRVIETIRNGTGDVTRIKISWLGQPERGRVTVIVSLPKAIFDAVITQFKDGPTQPIAACVFQAIDAADRDEVNRTPMTIIGPDELPF